MPPVDISLQRRGGIDVGVDVLGLGLNLSIGLGGSNPSPTPPAPSPTGGSSQPPAPPPSGGSNNGSGNQSNPAGSSNSGSTAPSGGAGSNNSSAGNSSASSTATSTGSSPQQSGSTKSSTSGSTSPTSGAAGNNQSSDPSGSGGSDDGSNSSGGGVANTGGSPGGHGQVGGSTTGGVGPNGQPIAPNGTLPPESGPRTNIGALAGGGCGVLLFLVILGFFFLRRRRRQKEALAAARRDPEKRFSMISAQSAQSAASLSSATSSQGLMQQPVASTSTNKRRFLPAWMKWRRTPKAPKSSGRSSLVPTLTSVDTSGSSWNLLHPEDPSSMHSHSPRSSCSSMQDESRSVSENTNLHSDETTSTTMLFSQPVVNSSQLQPPTTSHPNNSKYSFNGQYVPAPATNADIGGSKWVDSFQAKATRKTFFRSSQAFRLPDSPNEK